VEADGGVEAGEEARQGRCSEGSAATRRARRQKRWAEDGRWEERERRKDGGSDGTHVEEGMRPVASTMRGAGLAASGGG
jgi:hypothetical protein